MIAVDSSALIAILFDEPQAAPLLDRLGREAPGESYLSAVSYVETGTVVAGRLKDDPLRAIALLDEFLINLGIAVREVDEVQMRLAMQARIEHGRGFGAPAGLNFGDCFSYALAKALEAPLLYIGDDFSETDLIPALKLT